MLGAASDPARNGAGRGGRQRLRTGCGALALAAPLGGEREVRFRELRTGLIKATMIAPVRQWTPSKTTALSLSCAAVV